MTVSIIADQNSTNTPSQFGPKVLIIRVLETCNAGCFMCGFAFSDDSFRFGIQEANELVKKIQGSSYKLIRLTGGEPLLIPELSEIISVFSKTGLITSIISNGWHLQSRAQELMQADLQQIVVSLDGASSSTHDRFRQCPGLFQRAVSGIEELRSLSPNFSIRVNTVIGQHNVSELLSLHTLLANLNVDLWSIIPLKNEHGLMKYSDPRDVISIEEKLREAFLKTKRPRFIGDSAYWTGRSDEEKKKFFGEQTAFTPQGQCHLVDVVRYYTPKDGLVYPCNCVPHRVESLYLAEPASAGGLSLDGITQARDWLREHGPSFCKGCEPANVALGEMRTNLDADIFGF